MSGEVSAAPPPQLVADYPAEHYYHAHPAHPAHGRYNPYYPYQVRILIDTEYYYTDTNNTALSSTSPPRPRQQESTALTLTPATRPALTTTSTGEQSRT